MRHKVHSQRWLEGNHDCGGHPRRFCGTRPPTANPGNRRGERATGHPHPTHPSTTSARLRTRSCPAWLPLRRPTRRTHPRRPIQIRPSFRHKPPPYSLPPLFVAPAALVRRFWTGGHPPGLD
ncbi:hypothetical protein GQ55_4G012100 [Panicum hallii var. hallii]|uniref:Uncharacterized protein n=1 Tax=Panicum hallii var. hallii TaxID=1504633 RepID=A0A2T7DU24_9POAL|nr:hypothetical protein GQ55_4G012100 [Panicum hallii var. hallii]